MPIVRGTSAPTFHLPGLHVTSFAAPSLGARETSVWRLSIAPDTPGTPHSVDREEIFVALSGQALASLSGEDVELAPGDALIVRPGEPFSLANPGRTAFEAVAVAPVGIRATLPGGEPFEPPWTK